MKKELKFTRTIYHFDKDEIIDGYNDKMKEPNSRLYGNCSGIHGDCSRIHGDCSSLYGDCAGLFGDCSDLYGDCSRIHGDCSNIKGNLDDCELSEEDRKNGVNIKYLINKE